MLEELHIAGLGVIDDAWLSLHPGLNVLTGETGAGKTMVTVAVGLALGGRGSAGLVRPGAGRLAVEARFRAPGGTGGRASSDDGDAGDDLAEWLEPDGDGTAELVLARAVGSDGRSGGRINGRIAPAASLAGIGERLVEIHGQNQAERLASPTRQTEFLDRYAGPEHVQEVEAHRHEHAELTRASASLLALEEGARERERERDLLAYQVREIEAAAISPGEMAGLAQDEVRLAHAERIIGSAELALAALGEDEGALDRLRAAGESVKAVAALDPPAGDLAERLAGVAAEAADVAAELRAYRDRVELDPSRLAQVRERIQAVKLLERKYGDGEEGILEFFRQARDRLAALSDDQGAREALATTIAEVSERRARIAEGISARRAEIAPRLAASLTAEAQQLGMPGARIDLRLRPLSDPQAHGAEDVELTFSGGPNQPELPLARVASGGELSRTMLACRSVLADLDDVPTLVFDEVDAGIGGRAAAAVGRRLAKLARDRQVLVVTHLAQIAARADRHFLVTKEQGTALVHAVDGDERVAELARMLSGSTGDASLAHARALLDSPEEPVEAAGNEPGDAGTTGRRQRPRTRAAAGASTGRLD